VLDPQMTTGYIDLPMPVLSWSRRVLLFGDGEPLMLDPSGYEPDCRQVAVPAMPVFNVIRGYAALDSITYRADNLVRACETQDPLVIQRSVTKYHNEIAARLSGKHGPRAGTWPLMRWGCQRSLHVPRALCLGTSCY
jgi:hypothetical protein